MLSRSIWFSAPSFWIGGGLESRCVRPVYGVDGAVRHTAPSTPYTGDKNVVSPPVVLPEKIFLSPFAHKAGPYEKLCESYV